MILDKIVAHKKKKVAEEKHQLSLSKLVEKLDCIQPPRNFKNSLKKENQLTIIAEIKKASPSKGVIRQSFDPLEIAEVYEESCVEAMSVLTEDKFFQGSDDYLKQVRKTTSCPLLRKDFIIEAYQVYQSKLLGADAILLIAAILTKQQLIEFQRIAEQVGLYCLLEVHNEEELDKVLEAGGEIIGINNRNLKTFETTLKTTEKLISSVPKNKVIVSESGIHTREDMQFLQKLGVNAVLIGEGFMVAEDIGKKIRELRG
ncbi:indole-3-glycerol phosphate synthase TrpC [Clostridium aceticum]|uniref:Indole-3-glycerol phosphate synthase n=1 Tax=Clostridium aceticum TaxID=84022 RepID=A0A0D8IF63_9CLOT|nr:indole-3-glycerol phosphate synthase TrpC [Clostridium aceticum]AKL93953.1 indole-3-glycerol phosphate synthase TrpC [Clostridium aceticum]KJF28662.1 indole-3-glycerol phosphate synthase [Clostridium aceticum]